MAITSYHSQTWRLKSACCIWQTGRKCFHSKLKLAILTNLMGFLTSCVAVLSPIRLSFVNIEQLEEWIIFVEYNSISKTTYIIHLWYMVPLECQHGGAASWIQNTGRTARRYPLLSLRHKVGHLRCQSCGQLVSLSLTVECLLFIFWQQGLL